jgi:hypothetical protein
MQQYRLLLARAMLAASIAASGVVSVANATEAHRREAAATAGVCWASAATAAPKSGSELEQLGWEAALIDSSLFGQLRILRQVKPRIIEPAENTGTTERCR